MVNRLSITESDPITTPELKMIGVTQHKTPPPTPQQGKCTPKNTKKNKRHRRNHRTLNTHIKSVRRHPSLLFPPPPPTNRTYHVHNITPCGTPFHQIEDGIRYHNQGTIHQSVKNWNRDNSQQSTHHYNRIPTVLKDNTT